MLSVTNTSVVNLKDKKVKKLEEGEVYVGRQVINRTWQLYGTKWGNPFTLDNTPGGIQEVLKKYEQHVRADPKLMSSLTELEDKKLCCWCHPKPCHASVLLKLVEEGAAKRRAHAEVLLCIENDKTKRCGGCKKAFAEGEEKVFSGQTSASSGCGQAYCRPCAEPQKCSNCDKHVFEYCNNEGGPVACEGCGRRFCEDCMISDTNERGEFVLRCHDCHENTPEKAECKVCENQFVIEGEDAVDMITCDKCGGKVCPGCDEDRDNSTVRCQSFVCHKAFCRDCTNDDPDECIKTCGHCRLPKCVGCETFHHCKVCQEPYCSGCKEEFCCQDCGHVAYPCCNNDPGLRPCDGCGKRTVCDPGCSEEERKAKPSNEGELLCKPCREKPVEPPAKKQKTKE